MRPHEQIDVSAPANRIMRIASIPAWPDRIYRSHQT